MSRPGSAPEIDPGQPNRAMRFIREREWIGVTWSVGVDLDLRGRCVALTADIADHSLDVDPRLVSFVREAFGVLSQAVCVVADRRQMIQTYCRDHGETLVGYALDLMVKAEDWADERKARGVGQ